MKKIVVLLTLAVMTISSYTAYVAASSPPSTDLPNPQMIYSKIVLAATLSDIETAQKDINAGFIKVRDLKKQNANPNEIVEEYEKIERLLVSQRQDARSLEDLYNLPDKERILKISEKRLRLIQEQLDVVYKELPNWKSKAHQLRTTLSEEDFKKLRKMMEDEDYEK